LTCQTAVTNFTAALPPPQSDLAQQALKDPCFFDFLTLGDVAHDRDLQHGLLAHMQKFLLEMGVGFACVERDVKRAFSSEAGNPLLIPCCALAASRARMYLFQFYALVAGNVSQFSAQVARSGRRGPICGSGRPI
jgi:hypothetical protein